MERTFVNDRDRMQVASTMPHSAGAIDYESMRFTQLGNGRDVFDQSFTTLIAGNSDSIRPRAGFARTLRRYTKGRLSDDLFEQIAIERDEIAFQELYERLSPKVYGFLYRMLRNEDDALDVLQESFAELWNKAPILYGIHTNLAAWSLHLARNLGITQLRSRHHKYRSYMEPFEPELHEDLLSDEHTPEHDITQMEARRELRKALNKLEPEQRKGIEMVFFGGLTRSAAAEQLHLSLREFQGMFLDSLSELEHELFPLLGTRKAPRRPISKSKIAREEKLERDAALQRFLLGLPLVEV